MLAPLVFSTLPDEDVFAPLPAPEELAQAQPPRESRLRTFIRHPERSAALLALLIGFASVFSAVVAWRASLASIDASRYESLAVQQQARREQIERELESTVQQDLRFVTQFQEHALAARQLQEQADALRASDPDAADILDIEAQSRLALARSMKPFFLGATGVALDENTDTVPYDADFVLTNLRESNVEWRELANATPRSIALGQRADEKSLGLIGVGALIVAALFFLTVAQVSVTRPRVRQIFFVAGAVLVAFGSLAFVIVELVA
jgi:hypothetical protein